MSGSGGVRNKAVDTQGVAKDRLKVRSGPGDKSTGINNTRVVEPHGNLHQASAETVYEGENNNFIILGRDRPTDTKSGYGGRGDTHTSTIRMIAGLHLSLIHI